MSPFYLNLFTKKPGVFLNVGGFGRLGMSFFFCVLFSHVSPAEELKSCKTSDHKQLSEASKLTYPHLTPAHPEKKSKKNIPA